MTHLFARLAPAVAIATCCVTGISVSAHADPATAAARMSEPGPEGQQLAADVGTWDVVATLRPAPDAKPVVTKGLIAERALVGLYLQETMKPAAGSTEPDFKRIDYLTFSRVEGRWQYVSLDTRLPVGLMPATSFDKASDKKIELRFEPLAFVGLGAQVEGKMVRSTMVITRDGADHQVKEQAWVAADGTGRVWTAVQYDYRRHAKR